MVATVADLKDRIFRATGGRYTDTFHMLDLLNDALNELVDGAKLRGKTTISVVADDNGYAKPADFKAAYLLQDETNPNGIAVYPLVSIGENAFGYAVEDQIYLKPVPNTATTLTLYYYKYATQLSADSDTPEIDAQYHSALSDYAIWLIMLMPEMGVDKGTTDRFMQSWDRSKQSFITAMTKKNKLSRVREKVVW